jgi:hypothetical protein
MFNDSGHHTLSSVWPAPTKMLVTNISFQQGGFLHQLVSDPKIALRATDIVASFQAWLSASQTILPIPKDHRESEQIDQPRQYCTVAASLTLNRPQERK